VACLIRQDVIKLCLIRQDVIQLCLIRQDVIQFQISQNSVPLASLLGQSNVTNCIVILILSQYTKLPIFIIFHPLTNKAFNQPRTQKLQKNLALFRTSNVSKKPQYITHTEMLAQLLRELHNADQCHWNYWNRM
jgi:hypothetical protein